MRNFFRNAIRAAMVLMGASTIAAASAQNPDPSQYAGYEPEESPRPMERTVVLKSVVPVDTADTPRINSDFTFIDYSKRANADGNVVASEYPEYLSKAKKGDMEAMRLVALCHLTGTGVEEDFNEAWRWMGRAVKAGNARAEYDIATFYRDGYGVPQSYEESAYWFRKAASNGNVESMVEIGDQFADGKGVQQDNRIAAEYYWRAAERGDKRGAYRYATMLRDGRGVRADRRKAAQWFEKAGDYSDASVQLQNLGGSGSLTKQKSIQDKPRPRRR